MKNNLKKFRAAAGITQRELALDIGINTCPRPEAIISTYEVGRCTPSLKTCRDIIKSLNKAGCKEATLDSVFPT